MTFRINPCALGLLAGLFATSAHAQDFELVFDGSPTLGVAVVNQFDPAGAGNAANVDLGNHAINIVAIGQTSLGGDNDAAITESGGFNGAGIGQVSIGGDNSAAIGQVGEVFNFALTGQGAVPPLP